MSIFDFFSQREQQRYVATQTKIAKKIEQAKIVEISSSPMFQGVDFAERMLDKEVCMRMEDFQKEYIRQMILGYSDYADFKRRKEKVSAYEQPLSPSYERQLKLQAIVTWQSACPKEKL